MRTAASESPIQRRESLKKGLDKVATKPPKKKGMSAGANVESQTGRGGMLAAGGRRKSKKGKKKKNRVLTLDIKAGHRDKNCAKR